MTKTFRLKDLQLVLLSHAAARDNGSLLPLPQSCNQDTTRIRKAVTSLLRRKLVEEIVTIDPALCWRELDQDFIGLFITDTGRAAIGADEDQPETEEAASDAAATRSNGSDLGQTITSTNPRKGSKIGSVVALLQRDDGATLDEMISATGWLPHTTRAALTGLRKRGRTIAKSERGDVTCYRITAEG